MPAGQAPWEVDNYGGQGYGQMSLREASWKSVNTVYAQVAEEVRAQSIVDIARRAGIDRDLEPDPSIVLGSGEVTPLELATAYNTFAAGGMRRSPITVLKVERGGKVLYQNAHGKERRAFSEQVAWTVTDVLKGVIERGTARTADIGRPAAGKTGTTTNYADAWFAGYTPHLTTVVWLGNRDSREAMEGKPTGGGLPAQLWGTFMAEALKGVPPQDFPKPSSGLTVERPSPEPTETQAPCPDGQEAVVAEREAEGDAQGGDPDDLQRVCAPKDEPSEPSEPSESASPLPTLSPAPSEGEGGEATRSPSPSPSPTPTPTPTSPSPSASPPGTAAPSRDSEGETQAEG
jgi:penicillin-binding protein 1A